ncbi:MAG: chorismate synthase [Bacteroidia bacterium]|nr:chorismate synthase [Bacteroidia bacterium]
MAGNSFGQLFRITTFGESHGKAIGVVVDGCPAGLEIDVEFIQNQLSKRRPGQSEITTSRTEADNFDIISGVFEGKSTGAPICLLIANKDQRSKDYEHLKDVFRPSHADFTYEKKYGIRDYKGGGRSSARETAARVAAGAIAMLLLKRVEVSINAYVSQVGTIKIPESAFPIDYSNIENNLVRCPHEDTAAKMEVLIKEAKDDGDTVGGVITCVAENVPIGLGEPVFDKLHAELAKASMSINAAKGFEIGSGFASAAMFGSMHNDPFINEDNKITTESNFSGGIQGGISNGQPIVFNVAFKPVSTIQQQQKTVNQQGEEVEIKAQGRHDPCVVPRAVPIVESMAALVLADYYLRQKSDKI